MEQAENILVLTPNLHRPFGGPPVTILRMVAALNEAGHNVDVAFVGFKGSLLDSDIYALREKGVQFQLFHAIFKSSWILRWGLSIRFVIYAWKKSRQCTTVLIHQIWGIQLVMLQSRDLRARTVQIPHESLTSFDFENKNFLKTAMKRLQISLCRHIKVPVLFSSQLELNTSIREGVSLSAVAYHPIGLSLPSIRQTNTVRNCITIGYIGRLHSKKNVAALIQAVADTPDIELVIAGAGGDEQILRRIAQAEGVETRVHWAGFVQGAQKEDFFAKIDACAMPSTYECFGQAAAEALLRGIPLIVSRQVGAVERLRDGVELLICGVDRHSIGAALSRFRALTEQERLSMGSAGALKAQELFSNRAFVQSLLHLRRQAAA